MCVCILYCYHELVNKDLYLVRRAAVRKKPHGKI